MGVAPKKKKKRYSEAGSQENRAGADGPRKRETWLQFERRGRFIVAGN